MLPNSPLTSVLPGKNQPADLAALVLRGESFSRAILQAAEQLCNRLAQEGFCFGSLRPEGLGWSASLVDPAHGHELRFSLFPAIGNDGRVEILAQVHAAGSGSNALVAQANLGSTSSLRGLATAPDALQRIADELDTRMAFTELAPGQHGGVVRAIRLGKRFAETATWVPDAALVLLSELSLR